MQALLEDFKGAHATRRVADDLERDSAQSRAVVRMMVELEWLRQRHQREIDAAARITHRSVERILMVQQALTDPTPGPRPVRTRGGACAGVH